MKKENIYIIMTFTIICFNNYSYGQASSAGVNNSPVGGSDYLGWTSGTNRSLEINNQDPFPINFSTNNMNRMTISSGGNFGINFTTPNYLLHQDGGGSATATFHQFTNGSTLGTTGTDGFLVGIATTGIAEFRQQEAQPIIFFSQDALSLKERMRITFGNGWNGAAVPNVTKVNISYGPGTFSPITNSVAILNLGENIPTGGGARSWMEKTLC